MKPSSTSSDVYSLFCLGANIINSIYCHIGCINLVFKIFVFVLLRLREPPIEASQKWWIVQVQALRLNNFLQETSLHRSTCGWKTGWKCFHLPQLTVPAGVLLCPLDSLATLDISHETFPASLAALRPNCRHRRLTVDEPGNIFFTSLTPLTGVQTTSTFGWSMICKGVYLVLQPKSL